MGHFEDEYQRNKENKLNNQIQKDFDRSKANKTKPHIQIPDVKWKSNHPRNETEIDKWALIDINLFKLPEEGIENPEVREHLRSIAVATIKLRYPDTHPFVIRIEEMQLKYEISRFALSVRFKVTEQLIFKR